MLSVAQIADILGASHVETIRFTIKKLGITPSGSRKFGKYTINVYDESCIALIKKHCNFKLSGKREVLIRNIEIKKFLSTPMVDGVTWKIGV